MKTKGNVTVQRHRYAVPLIIRQLFPTIPSYAEYLLAARPVHFPDAAKVSDVILCGLPELCRRKQNWL
jgi:hypothetical protein